MSNSMGMVRARIGLEALEDRLVPANINIVGGAGNDTVVVTTVSIFGQNFHRVTHNGVNTFYNAAAIGNGIIVFNGNAGNDYFRNDTTLRASASGGLGNDTLIGGSNNDTLDGGLGVDYLYGRGGNDTLIAGYDFSYNYLDGGDGNDVMYGGYGNDWMYGQAGNDYMLGSYGNDVLFGGDGNDTMLGEAGNDYLNGGNGWDYLNGGVGWDVGVLGEVLVLIP